jgi:hypothetical protein
MRSPELGARVGCAVTRRMTVMAWGVIRSMVVLASSVAAANGSRSFLLPIKTPSANGDKTFATTVRTSSAACHEAAN